MNVLKHCKINDLPVARVQTVILSPERRRDDGTLWDNYVKDCFYRDDKQYRVTQETLPVAWSQKTVDSEENVGQKREVEFNNKY